MSTAPSASRIKNVMRPLFVPLFVLMIAASLVAGISGGLTRAGVGMPAAVVGPWLTTAVVSHAFLMICAFMGTLIATERAVALKHPLAFAGPLASGLGGVAMLAGRPELGAWLVAAASAAFVLVTVVIVKRQRAPHTVLLLVAGLAWCAGSVVHALGGEVAGSAPAATPGEGAVVPLWFSFLVLTIAAERLEMTRLMRQRAGAAPVLYGIFSLMLTGAALSGWPSAWAGVLYGLSLLALGLWLMAFDIARRTIHAHGLSRYMAVCLLTGYGWLCVAGLAWMGTSLGGPWRDAALHALALGFVFSMMLGHAPVILPALTRVKVLFGWVFYLPLAMLHASLLVRLWPGGVTTLATGARGNALAIASFVLVVLGAVVAWRIKYSGEGTQTSGRRVRRAAPGASDSSGTSRVSSLAVQGASSVRSAPTTTQATPAPTAGRIRLLRR